MPRNAYHMVAGLQNLRTLVLTSTESSPNNRINADGNLGALSSLRSLRHLAAMNLQSDRGMELLSQLTSLAVSFPDHLPPVESVPEAVIAAHICPDCGELHSLAFLDDYTDYGDTTLLGPCIGRLTRLQELYAHDLGGSRGANAELNTLSLINNSLSSLTKLGLSGVGAAGARRFVARLFDTLPSVEELEAGFDTVLSEGTIRGLRDGGGRALQVTLRQGAKVVWRRGTAPSESGSEPSDSSGSDSQPGYIM
eukprot:scaffold6.g2793.t1